MSTYVAAWVRAFSEYMIPAEPGDVITIEISYDDHGVVVVGRKDAVTQN